MREKPARSRKNRGTATKFQTVVPPEWAKPAQSVGWKRPVEDSSPGQPRGVEGLVGSSQREPRSLSNLLLPDLASPTPALFCFLALAELVVCRGFAFQRGKMKGVSRQHLAVLGDCCCPGPVFGQGTSLGHQQADVAQVLFK